MSRFGKIARRSFLVGAAAVAGGVAFGVWRYKSPYKNPLLEGLNSGEAALTPYVLIRPDGITLITPRADVGQGAYQVQATLLAEELDVRLDQVALDPGPPDVAYWNTALAEEAGAFIAPGGGFAQEAATTVVAAASKFMGLHITGGSTTVPDGFDKLRAAGASARETLKLAAAQQSGHNAADLTTKDGAVILPDGTALPYTDLAQAAALLDPVTDVALRPASEWRLIGKPSQRQDIVAKSTGTQTYGIDIDLPGMVYATVLLNPAQGGPLGKYDTAQAFTDPGLLSVVEITGGLGVVADNTWRAFKAARAIEVNWPDGPIPPEMDAHWQALSGSFTAEAQDSRKRDDGDVKAALTGACLLYTSPSPRDRTRPRMPSSA